MLPNSPKFRKTLDALTVRTVSQEEKEKLGDRVSEVCKPERVGRAFGPVPERGDTYMVLALRRETEIPIRGLIDKVVKGLVAVGHSFAEEDPVIARSLAAKIIAVAVHSHSRFEILQELFRLVSSAWVSSYAVTDLPAEKGIFSVGDFTIGKFNFNSFGEACDRAGSDYAVRYGTELSAKYVDKFVITRKPVAVKAVNIKSSSTSSECSSLVWSGNKTITEILEQYHSTIATRLMHEFARDLDRQQSLFEAIGETVLRSNFLLYHPAIQTKFITIFERVTEGQGWVVPWSLFTEVGLPNLSRIQQKYAIKRRELYLTDWPKFPIDDHLQSFCEYLQKASDVGQGIEEGILYRIFGLDLLLGGGANKELVETLASRVAVLCHRAFGDEFEEVKKFVRNTYGLRSSYVHRGKLGNLAAESAGMTLLERNKRLGQLCQIVFAAGVFARQKTWCQGEDGHEQWLNNIDFIIATRKAGKKVQLEDISNLGLDKIRFLDDKEPPFEISWPHGIGDTAAD
jgi:hypothetical protein